VYRRLPDWRDHIVGLLFPRTLRLFDHHLVVVMQDTVLPLAGGQERVGPGLRLAHHVGRFARWRISPGRRCYLNKEQEAVP
jgi:hypothetical protein